MLSQSYPCLLFITFLQMQSYTLWFHCGMFAIILTSHPAFFTHTLLIRLIAYLFIDSLRLFPQKARTVNNSHPLGIDINAIECGACKLGVTLIQTLSKQNSSQAEIVSKLTSFCHTFHIEDRRVCHGMVYSFQV